MPHVLDALPSAFRETAAGLPDRRAGRRNKRYEVSDAAGCAPACCCTRCESFLAFQRRMERDGSRSNCRTLFGVGRIPCDSRIRNLLDDPDPAAFDPLFRLCLETVAAPGALEPFQRLDERLPAAPDGVRFHRSDTVHGPQCSVRRVGSERRPHHFHAMVAATAVADGHATVLPLMPEFACPQQAAAATRADMSEDERKRDCERNAAKRRIAAQGAWLQACRPVLLGDDLYCCQPVREAAAAAGMDCIRVGKPGSRKHLHEVPESRRASGAVRSTGWLPRRGKGKRSERHRFRRTAAAPLRQGRDALRGTWIEYAVERDGKRTCANSFFTGLAVTADNAERIARAGRARWKIENEGCNCLARHGRNCKRNFGHGKEGPANVPAVPNPFAFALHAVVQCVCALRQQCRRQPVTPRALFQELFQELQVALRWFRFPDWPTLLAAVRASGLPGGRAAGAWTPRSFVPAAAGRQSRLPPECVRPRARHSADPRRGPHHGPARRPTLPRGGLGSATSRSTYSPHPPKQRSRTPLTAKFRTADRAEHREPGPASALRRARVTGRECRKLEKGETGRMSVTTSFARFDSIELDCGHALAPVDVAYETYGTLNAERSNAILVLHAFSGDAHAAGISAETGRPGWWDNMVGPGKAFDTRKYFVISTNVLGGCNGTTGPSSTDPATGRRYGSQFPAISIADMVRLQQMLTDSLGIRRLLSVSGGSMGGMQALQWAVSYPDRVASVIPIATTHRHSAQQIAFNEVGRQAILADPDFNGGEYYDGKYPERGLAVARMVGHITYMSDDSMREKFGRRRRAAAGQDDMFEVESYLRYRGVQFVSRFDANAYIVITRAMDTFDIAGASGELEDCFTHGEARFLVLSFTSDWLYPSYQSQEIVRALRSRNRDVAYIELESNYGHDAFLLEAGEQTALIQGFLENTFQRLAA